MEGENTKKDLIWIIPEIVGELFLYGYIPIKLISSLADVDILSTTALVYMAVTLLLVKSIELKGIRELCKIRFKFIERRFSKKMEDNNDIYRC